MLDMGMFSRRIMQSALDQLESEVTPVQMRDWLRRLNKASPDYSATEWEIALLHAFSKAGTVRHEPSTGQSKVDLVFSSPKHGVQFAADIVSISDNALHKNNPIADFENAVNAAVLEAKITNGGIAIQVYEKQPVPNRFHNRKRKLLLPDRADFIATLNSEEVQSFLSAIQQEPCVPRDRRFTKLNQYDFSLHYRNGLGKGARTSTYASYTSTTAKDDNPLFNALKNKASQLRRASLSGLKGVIVCDRGARVLNEMSNWSTFSMREVVNEFFRQNSSIAFVLIIAIDTRVEMFGRFSKAYKSEFFVNSDEIPAWAYPLKSVFDEVLSKLPRIVQTSENASHEMKWNGSTLRTKAYLGESHMKLGVIETEIKISTRELLDLLAGKLNYDAFARNHALRNDETIFEQLRQRRMMIVSSSVEARPDADDDWIVLKFSPGDPAVNPFREKRVRSRMPE